MTFSPHHYGVGGWVPTGGAPPPSPPPPTTLFRVRLGEVLVPACGGCVGWGGDVMVLFLLQKGALERPLPL